MLFCEMMSKAIDKERNYHGQQYRPWPTCYAIGDEFQYITSRMHGTRDKTKYKGDKNTLHTQTLKQAIAPW